MACACRCLLHICSCCVAKLLLVKATAPPVPSPSSLPSNENASMGMVISLSQNADFSKNRLTLLTHLNQPLNLGDPWRPLATMPENGQNGQNDHFQAWSPRVAEGRQGFPRSQGDPRDGWDELEPNRSYLSHFPTWYSKSGHFPIEIPIKNKNLSL